MNYICDLMVLVPTLGGDIMESSLRGSHDVSALDDRHDLLLFLSEPFKKATGITRPITAEIYATTNPSIRI
jgi:hypothetical protein